MTSAYISYSARRFNKRIHSDASLSVELALNIKKKDVHGSDDILVSYLK